MHRIQVQLTERQEAMLRELARLRGESISSLIRVGVDRLLEPQLDPRAARLRVAGSIVGIVADDADASENHDRHLAELYAESTSASGA
jgi:Arc/MetJ-type ribon-helix-helix transcriptional regulator